ncbi:MAG: hypothetical protein J6J36_08835 [Clostridia bacterium]|nr:hypothetical protein [Clostridia bacterium]
MDGDMNDIFQKLNSMLSDEETRSNLKNILGNISSSDNSSSKTDFTSQSSSTENANNAKDNINDSSNSTSDSNKAKNFDFDIQTFLKLQSILKNINNSSNDSRSNLLLSLKPYLRDSKKEKLDQYIKMLNLAKIIEVMGPLGGESKKNE